ncbi:tyrosine-type recombinase/integrase [Caproicibacterium sp. BJN0003]|uniref:tyrosine-type recombinase/integrase n=1 Tax=Caproicibacterium sp. BJN0003 TaxID=2994078 RepID=UPI00225A98DC|nr:tyrosine-type recombinase/integrase [Caproicibacterium sp. BJN0003]UZT82106.1 tyrosine-type recombinase/integrase [Caproicibacterium sp. BJN0003]
MPNCKNCRKKLSDDWIYCPWCGKKQIETKRKTIKRENGTGSIFKRYDIKNRPYVALCPSESDKKREAIGYYATAQEAKDALYDYKKNPTDKLNITLEELYAEWKPIGLKDKSKQLSDSYRAAYNKLSPLWKIRFREIGYGQVQNILESLQKPHTKCDKKGVATLKGGKPVILPPSSYSSLHDVKVLCGLLCKFAAKNNIVRDNWAVLLDLPKKSQSVKDCFDDLERKKIENAAFGTAGSEKVPFADFILFMTYTGLRITEFLNLTKFSVRESNGNYALYGGIKTDAGKNKVVPVHHKIVPILKEWIAKGGQTVFCKDDGSPYRAEYFRKKCYYPALEQIGVRKLSPHATRRTCATMMSAAGVREEDFIAIMGHTDFSVDIDSYIFQTAEKLQPAIEKLS